MRCKWEGVGDLRPRQRTYLLAVPNHHGAVALQKDCSILRACEFHVSLWEGGW